MSRTFLVTGAASGIGHHLARELLKRGERVLACDMNRDGMQPLTEALADTARLRIETLDVRDAAAWDRVVAQMAEKWGSVDVVMNVAGVLRPEYVENIAAKDIDFHIDINTKGVMFGTVAAVKVMTKQGHGHIINIASTAGIAPVPGMSLYSASKFAVRGFTLSIAPELAAKNIRVTCVCPDATQTPMLTLQEDKPQAALTFSGPRLLTVEDIGKLILGRVLETAPIEAIIPASRGWMAKIASAFPGLNKLMMDALVKKGMKKQQAIRAGH